MPSAEQRLSPPARKHFQQIVFGTTVGAALLGPRFFHRRSSSTEELLDIAGIPFIVYHVVRCTSGLHRGGQIPAGGSAHARNGRGCQI